MTWTRSRREHDHKAVEQVNFQQQQYDANSAQNTFNEIIMFVVVFAQLINI